MINLYGWGLPSKAEYLRKYTDEELSRRALSLWNNLDSACIYFIVTAIVLGIVLVCCYYYVYNKYPGKKYRVSHWLGWMIITIVMTVAVTFVLGNLLISSGLNELTGFLLRIALINGLYAAIVYFIGSFLICNLPIPTNAYRFLKIGK